jgi:hypothetical protein
VHLIREKFTDDLWDGLLEAHVWHEKQSKRRSI